MSGKARQAFRIDQEPERVRQVYGCHSLGERTLLARRLVEAGVTFVTVSGTFGVFDNHGDDVVWGGLIKGLKPLLPLVDQTVFALINDRMSILVAGGGLSHGQVIGSTDPRGGEVRAGRVTPADIGATVYRHLGINLDTHWTDGQGRPQPIVTQGGRPIRGLE
jgi:hypothetical protein